MLFGHENVWHLRHSYVVAKIARTHEGGEIAMYVEAATIDYAKRSVLRITQVTLILADSSWYSEIQTKVVNKLYILDYI